MESVDCDRMDYSLQVVLTRLVKFASVFTYAGGIGIGLWGDNLRLRKRAVHLFASPALVAIWLSGYMLTLQNRVPLLECWILGGFITSLLGHLLLTQATHRPSTTQALRLATVAMFGASLGFMVLRPTWVGLWP